MQDFIELAHHLADEAGKIIRPYFRADIDVEHKSDESPVTIADKNVEKRLRKIIEAKRPDDGIIGEEFGNRESKNQYEWVLDPIDGTKSFVAGRPTFGSLIALCENGLPILGIIDQPILNERWIGVEGQATLFNGNPIKTAKCSDVSNIKMATTDPYYLDNVLIKTLQEKCDFIAWGGDCYSFGLLANGHLDCVVENGLSTYDYAALPPIINGAGGHMCDWNGNPLTIKSEGHVLALGDVALKDDILNILNS